MGAKGESGNSVTQQKLQKSMKSVDKIVIFLIVTSLKVW